MDRQDYIVIGKVAGVFGVKGWLKVQSFTEPRENLLSYKVWHLRKANDVKTLQLQSGQLHGKGTIVKLNGIDDRDQAALLSGWEVLLERSQLPPAGPGEYYWADLEGLQVETIQGVQLGKVDYLMETGANDVLVVKGERERLIPFLREQTIIAVDLSLGKIIVDWDPEF